MIDYPVTPTDIVLLGKPANFTRSFIIRPLREGQYSLILAPKSAMSNTELLRFDINFPDLLGPPKQLRVEIPPRLQKKHQWHWKLLRWPDHIQNEQLKPLTPTTDQPRHDENEDGTKLSTVELFFLYRDVASGYFKLEESTLSKEHKLIMWSCNQPFDTSENGGLVLLDTTKPALAWALKQVNAFKPELVWILGDAAYSDGTDASNFVDEYYDQPGWAADPEQVEELRQIYRNMYRGHWSFDPLQKIMRSIPHLCIWDDHEIRDGWGSEAGDFKGSNKKIYDIARSVADEYLLNNGPRVRDPIKEPEADAHQAYFDGNVAAFMFDGRSSRRYHRQNGHVISPQQLNDFKTFCERAVNKPEVKFLIMGCGVPFINLKDFVETLGSKAPKALTDMVMGIRDDVRDSWHSPGNKEALKDLISVLRSLQRRRGDIEVVNISGDIHVANAFTFQPLGFHKVMYQITSSALTNRQHMPAIASELLSVGTEAFSDVLGIITRVWSEVSDPNLMTISNHGEFLRFELKVYDLDIPSESSVNSAKDKVLDVGAHSLSLGYVV